MNKSDRYLDEFFAKARIEPPVITEEEILTALDEGSLPGQQLPRPEQLSHNTLRGKIMKGVVVAIIAGSIGSTALYLTDNSSTRGTTPSVASMAPQSAAGSQKSVALVPDRASPRSIVSAPEAIARDIVAPAPSRERKPGSLPRVPSTDSQAAKENTPKENTDSGLDSALARQLGEELSKVAADYWVAKINSYRVRIDRMLSPSDLSELNRLRVRAGIMMKNRSGDSTGSVSFRVDMGGHDGGSKVHMKAEADGKEVSEQDDEDGIMQMMQTMMSHGEGEPFRIYNGVKGIAGRYRGDLDLLKNDIFSDLASFVEMMGSRVDGFIEEHRSQISKEKLDTLTAHMQQVHEKLNAAELKSSIGMIYGFIGEPLLMLYNGSDIGSLIPGSLAAPVPGVKIAENMTLKQSYPNPAGTSTTIGYSLSEPTTSALLRLYDASGNIVATFDQGAQPAGEHSVAVDLSKLASGTYLYHLTIQTSKGEQVFSKTLQVAR
jgi:hypothetical protein